MKIRLKTLCFMAGIALLLVSNISADALATTNVVASGTWQTANEILLIYLPLTGQLKNQNENYDKDNTERDVSSESRTESESGKGKGSV